MTDSTEPALLPTVPHIGEAFQRLVTDVSDWLTNHYIELIIALAIGTAIFFLLGAIKRFAARFVRNNEGLTGYRTCLLYTSDAADE